MDPNQALNDILEMIDDFENVSTKGIRTRFKELAEAVENLDQWLERGGFLPDRWQGNSADRRWRHSGDPGMVGTVLCLNCGEPVELHEFTAGGTPVYRWRHVEERPMQYMCTIPWVIGGKFGRYAAPPASGMVGTEPEVHEEGREGGDDEVEEELSAFRDAYQIRVIQFSPDVILVNREGRNSDAVFLVQMNDEVTTLQELGTFGVLHLDGNPNLGRVVLAIAMGVEDRL